MSGMALAGGGGLCISGSTDCDGSNEVYLYIGFVVVATIGLVALSILLLGWRAAIIGMVPRRLQQRLRDRWLPTDGGDSPLDRLRRIEDPASPDEVSGPPPAADSPALSPLPEPDSPPPSAVAASARPSGQPDGQPESAVVRSHELAPGKRRGSFARELPLLVLVAVVLAVLIKTFLVQAFFIPSGSMEQTLHIHDRVLVNKLAFHTGNPQRGEIVVFNTAGTKFAQDNAEVVSCPSSNVFVRGARAVERFVGLATCGEDDYIKRIIAVPGDTIQEVQGGPVLLNGHPLTEPYVFDNNYSAFCEASYLAASYSPSLCTTDAKPITVPQDMYWVMGDHRDDSQDSRYEGFVPRNKIVGRAFIRILPVSRIGLLRVPHTFAHVTPTAADLMPIGAGLLPLGCLAQRRQRRGRR